MNVNIGLIEVEPMQDQHQLLNKIQPIDPQQIIHQIQPMILQQILPKILQQNQLMIL